nr:G patch domain-containing protein 11 [Ipomoea batatas]
MAEGEDEDYMGDLSQFLPPEASVPSKKVSNSKPVVSNSTNKRKPLSWQEQRKLKRQQKQVEEDQQTLSNLELAIPQSNIGFKMLKQMGYTPGSTLGKDGSGRAEPVAVEIRRGRAGLGKEDSRLEKARKEIEKLESEKMKEKELLVEFEHRQKERWKGRRIVVNFHKAEAVLAHLLTMDVVIVQLFEQDLLKILMKLRDEYHYCLFCGCRYESSEALVDNCPGIMEEDH